MEYERLLTVDHFPNPLPGLPNELMSVMISKARECKIISNSTCTPSSLQLVANSRVQFRVDKALRHPEPGALVSALHRDLSTVMGVSYQMLMNTTIDTVHDEASTIEDPDSSSQGWSLVSTTLTAPVPAVVREVLREGLSPARLSNVTLRRVNALMKTNNTRLAPNYTVLWVRFQRDSIG